MESIKAEFLTPVMAIFLYLTWVVFTDSSQDCYLQFEYLLNKREQGLTTITRGLTG